MWLVQGSSLVNNYIYLTISSTMNTRESDYPDIQIAEFAQEGENWELTVTPGIRDVQMKHSDWTARALLLHKNFGADEIRFWPGEGVWTHTHEGDHILMVTKISRSETLGTNLLWSSKLPYTYIDFGFNIFHILSTTNSTSAW